MTFTVIIGACLLLAGERMQRKNIKNWRLLVLFGGGLIFVAILEFAVRRISN